MSGGLKECDVGEPFPIQEGSNKSYFSQWEYNSYGGANSDGWFQGTILSYFYGGITFSSSYKCDGNRIVYNCAGRVTNSQTHPSIDKYLESFPNTTQGTTPSVYTIFPTHKSEKYGPPPFAGPFGSVALAWLGVIYIETRPTTFERVVAAFTNTNNSDTPSGIIKTTSWFNDYGTQAGYNNRKTLLSGIWEQNGQFRAYDICLFLAAIYKRSNWNPVDAYFHRNCTSPSDRIPVPVIIDVAKNENVLLKAASITAGWSHYTGPTDSGWIGDHADIKQMNELVDYGFEEAAAEPLMNDDTASGVISDFLNKYYPPSTSTDYRQDLFLNALFSISTPDGGINSSTNNVTLLLYQATNAWLGNYCFGDKFTQNNGNGWCYNWLVQTGSTPGLTNAQNFCQSNKTNIYDYQSLCGCLMNQEFYEDLKTKAFEKLVNLENAGTWLPSCMLNACALSGLRSVAPLSKGITCPSQVNCGQMINFTTDGDIEANVTQNIRCSLNGVSSDGTTTTGTSTSTATTTDDLSTFVTNIFTPENIIIFGAVGAVCLVLIFVVFVIVD